MDTTSLKLETLGIKHKQYNELLGKVLKGEKSINLEDVNFDKHDLDNLLMIDVACEKRDIEYVLNALKSKDMLCISRVLQKCTWLYNDSQYSHIINAKYLYEELFPKMTTKAGKKLIKYIRHHLKDEPRVEQFYEYENNIMEAIKWLPNCSIAFIEGLIEEHIHKIKPKLFKRLCEKSITIFEITLNRSCNSPYSQYAIFLLNTHTEEYLDILLRSKYSLYPTFNAKSTAFLMKKIPERMMNNFPKYVRFIHIATFAKHMRKEDIKDFLFEQASKDLYESHNYYLRTFLESPDITYLIERIPREERFDFVKSVFIDKIADEDENEIPLDPEVMRMKKLSQAVRMEKHEWYRYAPFNIAFEELTKMIEIETHHEKQYSILLTLIRCVGKNNEKMQTLLQYYISTHINDVFQLKNQFVNNLIQQSQIYKCDQKSWEILSEIFTNMEIYIDNDQNVQDCVIAIILHNTLNDLDVPEIIKKKFVFDNLATYRNKLNTEEQEKVFTFLYNYLIMNKQNQCTTETEFKEVIETLDNIMNLLKDWKKELKDYPFVLEMIKEMTQLKQDNSWKTSLSSLYNLKKSWRKHMFEESLILDPSQKVCVNALKHDPGLLLRHNEQVKKLCFDDQNCMRVVHRKLRIYWPDSLAIDWANAYRERLNILGGHKALIRGLCSLVPENTIINIFKDYAPKAAKVNWAEIDELTLSLQRHIAKNMHRTRPQIHPNAVLWYAKGDYLQYALPSLLSVFYNLTTDFCREFIPKLLDAPVSVQKHGIRFAFLRLEPTELKTIFGHIWNTSKNISIRSELFEHTFKLLCNTEEDAKVEEVWELLDLFIENLRHTDEAKIFDLLVRIEEVPETIRPVYLSKCYNTFKRLLHHFKADRISCYENYMRTLAGYSREIMEYMDTDFVVEIVTNYLDKELFNFEGKIANLVNSYDGMVKVVSAYLLCTTDIEEQNQRYETILVPVMKRLFNMESNVRRESNNMENFTALLFRFYKDLNDYVINNNMIIPYKMFCDIQKELKSLPVPENYTTITMWKLTVAFTKLLSETDTTRSWDGITGTLAQDFGNICTSYLNEEVTTRFPCIYVIFSRVLDKLLDQMPEHAIRIVYDTMLEDKKFVQAFLAVIIMLPKTQYVSACHNVNMYKYPDIHRTILKQTLPEIQMHYYSKFKKDIDDCS